MTQRISEHTSSPDIVEGVISVISNEDSFVREVVAKNKDGLVVGAAFICPTDMDDELVGEAFVHHLRGTKPDAENSPRLFRKGLNDSVFSKVILEKTWGKSENEISDLAEQAYARVIGSSIEKPSLDALAITPSFGFVAPGKMKPVYDQSVLFELLQSGDRIARQQTFSTFPILYDLMIEEHVAGKKDGLLSIIDDRKPIRPYLQDYFDLDDPAFKTFIRMAHLSSDAAKTTETLEFGSKKIAKSSMSLRQDQIPSSWKDCKTAIQVVDRAIEFAETQSIGKKIIDKFISGIKPDQWDDARKIFFPTYGQHNVTSNITDAMRALKQSLASALLSKHVRISDPETFDEADRAISDILEEKDIDSAVKSSVERVSRTFNALLKSPVYESICKSVAEIIGDHSSFKRLNERATRWHHSNKIIEAKVMTANTDISWQPWIGSVNLKRCKIREISSSRELVEQGEKERHCVGSYSSVILKPQLNTVTAIFSIEDETGTLSTLEVQARMDPYSRSGTSLFSSIKQHAAAENKEPCPKAVSAAYDLIEYLNDLPVEDHLAYFEAIHMRREKLREEAVSVIHKMHGQVFKADMHKVTAEALEPVLPKQLRDQDLDILSTKVNEKLSEKGISLQDIADHFSGVSISDAVIAFEKAEREKVFNVGRNVLPRHLSNSIHLEGAGWEAFSRSLHGDDMDILIAHALSSMGVTEVMANLSGSGDSGDIDDILFSGKEMEDAIEDKLSGMLISPVSMPGQFLQNIYQALEEKILSDANSEGNWYDNEGGHVEASYVVEDGDLHTEYVTLTHNEYEEDEYDEDEDYGDDDLDQEDPDTLDIAS